MRTSRVWLLVMASLWAGCVSGCVVDDDDNDDASDDDTAPADEDDETTDDDTADDEPTVDELLQRSRPEVIQQLAEDNAVLPYTSVRRVTRTNSRSCAKRWTFGT